MLPDIFTRSDNQTVLQMFIAGIQRESNKPGAFNGHSDYLDVMGSGILFDTDLHVLHSVLTSPLEHNLDLTTKE